MNHSLSLSLFIIGPSLDIPFVFYIPHLHFNNEIPKNLEIVFLPFPSAFFLIIILNIIKITPHSPTLIPTMASWFWDHCCCLSFVYVLGWKKNYPEICSITHTFHPQFHTKLIFSHMFYFHTLCPSYQHSSFSSIWFTYYPPLSKCRFLQAFSTKPVTCLVSHNKLIYGRLF